MDIKSSSSAAAAASPPEESPQPKKGNNGGDLHYTIRRTWDDRDPVDDDEIHVTFEKTIKGTQEEEGDEEDGLVVSVEAPFYNDPRVDETTPPGSLDKLWEYEVVEVFLVGDEDKYLEIELAPSGHYLLLLLHGHRNMVQHHLPLKSYTPVVTTDNNNSSSDGGGGGGGVGGNRRQRWSARVIIPYNYLPINITRFNAYAIHKSDPNRQYMALFPTPTNKFEQPDFHRLDYFQNIDLSHLIRKN